MADITAQGASSGIALALQILSLVNAAEPGIASLIAIFRKSDGTVTVINFLDQADTAVDANMKQIADWMTAHPKGV